MGIYSRIRVLLSNSRVSAYARMVIKLAHWEPPLLSDVDRYRFAGVAVEGSGCWEVAAHQEVRLLGRQSFDQS